MQDVVVCQSLIASIVYLFFDEFAENTQPRCERGILDIMMRAFFLYVIPIEHMFTESPSLAHKLCSSIAYFAAPWCLV